MKKFMFRVVKCLFLVLKAIMGSSTGRKFDLHSNEDVECNNTTSRHSIDEVQLNDDSDQQGGN